MQVIRWLIKKTFLFLIFIPGLLCLFLFFLLKTTSGLYLAAALNNIFSNTKITLQAAEGANLHNLALKELVLSQDEKQLQFKNFVCPLNWYELVHKTLHLNARFQEGKFILKKQTLFGLTNARWKTDGLWSKPLLLQSSLEANLAQDPFVARLDLKNETIKLLVNTKKNTLQLIKKTHTPWQLEAQIPHPELLHPALKGLKTSFHIKGKSDNLSSAVLNLHMEKGFFKSDNLHLDFAGASLDLVLNPQELKAKGTLLLAKELPRLGSHLDPVLFSFRSDGKQWNSKTSLGINGKGISIQGKGQISPKFTGLLHIQATDIPLLQKPDLVLFASTDLYLEKSAKTGLQLRGKILIPKAQIKPKNFTDTSTLSHDAVFVSDKLSKEIKPTYPNINTNISLEAGNEVSLEVKGLKAKIRGKIDIVQMAQQEPKAIGELYMADGVFKAFGQNMTISKGQFLFTDSITNPDVDIIASKKLKEIQKNTPKTLNNPAIPPNTTLGIEVKGKLDTLKIGLFSNPSTLSEADILSLLLIGTPANQASDSGAQLLFAAVSSMDLGSGNKGMELLSQLKQSIGIDFNLENNLQYDQKTKQTSPSTNLVLGKALSKRLYLSYNMGISQATLKYLLNQFFSLQVSASTKNAKNASGIDLQYTHQKD